MKSIIEKWYRKLKFPRKYDEEFFGLLDRFSLTNLTVIEEYNHTIHTAQENLLAYLYFCETLQKDYQKIGIDESILLDTLSDLVLWTDVWFSMTNELGLAQAGWVKRVLSFKLFRLGRLQFCFGVFFKDYPSISVKAGEYVLEVHIPADGKLSEEDCTSSFEMSKKFFLKYFPLFNYRYYSCDSWLLDNHLQSILGKNSNICRFGTRFREIDRHESDRILRYVFRWDASRENLFQFQANTHLAKALLRKVENGELFYEVLGVIPKEEV